MSVRDTLFNDIHETDLHTFTFFTLHDRHPPLVFVCGLRFLCSFKWFGALNEKTWKSPVILEAE